MRFIGPWRATKVSREKRRTKKIWVRNLAIRNEQGTAASTSVVLRWEHSRFQVKMLGESHWQELEAVGVEEAKRHAESLAIALWRMR